MAMKLLLPMVLLFAPSSWTAWVIEDIPTQIEFVGFVGFTVNTEIATAYRPIYDANGVKTSDDLTIVYRTKSLWIAQRRADVWSTIKLDNNGRYPALALDDQGKPHISYLRSNESWIYYAHPVQINSGNCGPNATWACEALPLAKWGMELLTPTGLSGIAVHGTKVHIMAEAPDPYGGTYLPIFKKGITDANWEEDNSGSGSVQPVKELSFQLSPQGRWRFLLRNTDELRWSHTTAYGYNPPPLYGDAGMFTLTANESVRLCYRDEAADRLIYARTDPTYWTEWPSYHVWSETVIDFNIGEQGNCAIALAPENGPQLPGYYEPKIAFFDEPSSSIMLATRQAISFSPPAFEWKLQSIAPAINAKKISLHLDKQGRPTIIYFDGNAWKLRLARWQ